MRKIRTLFPSSLFMRNHAPLYLLLHLLHYPINTFDRNVFFGNFKPRIAACSILLKLSKIFPRILYRCKALLEDVQIIRSAIVSTFFYKFMLHSNVLVYSMEPLSFLLKLMHVHGSIFIIFGKKTCVLSFDFIFDRVMVFD